MKKFLFLIVLFSACAQKKEFYRWENLPVKIQIHNAGQKEVIDFYNGQFSSHIFEESDEEGTVNVFPDANTFDEHGWTGWTDKKYEKGFIIWGEIGLMKANGYDFFDSSITSEGRIVFAHELMHLLGYSWHDDDPESLMYKVVPEEELENLFQPHLKDWIKETYNIE